MQSLGQSSAEIITPLNQFEKNNCEIVIPVLFVLSATYLGTIMKE